MRAISTFGKDSSERKGVKVERNHVDKRETAREHSIRGFLDVFSGVIISCFFHFAMVVGFNGVPFGPIALQRRTKINKMLGIQTE